MATAVKLMFKTPVQSIEWVNIDGKGKAKMNKDPNSEDPSDFNYVATSVYPNEKAMKKDKAIFSKFWIDNRPSGVTKQSYDMFKPEMRAVLDDKGKSIEDEEGATIKEPTGRWVLTAKTVTKWPDGKMNVVKVLRGNGTPLNLGDKLIGNGSIGVIHGTLGINSFAGNEGLAFYLSAIQLKKFVEFSGADAVEADDIGEDEGLEEVEMDNVDITNKPNI